jgi:hypothetical protein
VHPAQEPKSAGERRNRGRLHHARDGREAVEWSWGGHAYLHLHVRCGFCCDPRSDGGDTAQAICFQTGNLFFCARVGHWELGRRTAEMERSKRQASLRFPMWPPTGFFFVTAGNFGQGSAQSSPPFLLHSKNICFRIWLRLQAFPLAKEER